MSYKLQSAKGISVKAYNLQKAYMYTFFSLCFKTGYTPLKIGSTPNHVHSVSSKRDTNREGIMTMYMRCLWKQETVKKNKDKRVTFLACNWEFSVFMLRSTASFAYITINLSNFMAWDANTK